MRGQLIITLLLTALTGALRADEKLPLFPVGTTTYTNVTVTSVSATDVYFTHASGLANVKISDLSPEWQQHFSLSRPKTKVVTAKPTNGVPQAQTLTAKPAAASTTIALWRTDLPGALKQAQSENKLLLMDFTGSDWCGWCKKFDQEVLSTTPFANYAGRRLILVKLDFPQHTPQPAELTRVNKALAEQYQVTGYPTFVLLNASGKELGRQVGYLEGGPTAFINQLEGFAR